MKSVVSYDQISLALMERDTLYLVAKEGFEPPTQGL